MNLYPVPPNITHINSFAPPGKQKINTKPDKDYTRLANEITLTDENNGIKPTQYSRRSASSRKRDFGNWNTPLSHEEPLPTSLSFCPHSSHKLTNENHALITVHTPLSLYLHNTYHHCTTEPYWPNIRQTHTCSHSQSNTRCQRDI